MKTTTFQFRVTEAQRRRWRHVAGDQDEKESAWARDGLDAYSILCTKAAELDMNPHDLLTEALELHAQHRATVELLLASDLPAPVKERLLRVLSPRAVSG
jgi:hypothetical protein